MPRFVKNSIGIWLLAAAFCLTGSDGAWAQNMFCGAGNFGTVNTQATITGPNSMTMTYNGNISYPPPLNGPATGTSVFCLLTGWNGNANIQIDCDATRIIANPAGCCGTTNRTMTAFTVYGTGNTTSGPSACNGMGGGSSITFRTTGWGGGFLYFGTTMDATHVKIGGTYQLSNHAAGPLNIQARQGGTTRTRTANFSVAFATLVGFASQVDMQFGALSFTPPVTGSDTASLGTNGAISYGGSFTSQGGTVTPGSVLINNVQDGVTVEIYCDTTATLTKSGASSSSIQVTGIEAAAEDARGAYGAGSACNGIAGAPATTMLYAAGSRDEFFLGGRLNGATAASFADGDYSTANAGGDDIQVTVLNQ